MKTSTAPWVETKTQVTAETSTIEEALDFIAARVADLDEFTRLVAASLREGPGDVYLVELTLTDDGVRS